LFTRLMKRWTKLQSSPCSTAHNVDSWAAVAIPSSSGDRPSACGPRHRFHEGDAVVLGNIARRLRRVPVEVDAHGRM
jgi:hypothetical protein